ncbi:uncharacterized protein LOC18432839 isoform X1 [Amborella trichopoda]|uniref:uncharacterized protein LOC18432839 isoform X1 n=1 Tax=Amborella trichopoda TaxID=13333 RepID=UPI0009BD4FE8|nr:uncharacterized protein LOC18432839 isoform X1 [Amborella trichopoda]XP_020522053.1 uncharacterized protein LOC18432839 isoform X1 [Amborella trichopoda]XP_020522054.1 uncharacterized protein LOC18432839 isoform X1 [Amborella trichopoda]XP_020522055.1 uncharacterized protein LOC18432839 isoform X1 [Amborella trichopoda]|eukprot:XP_020522052.1 uncharacterized protein LOC18432839 isoform X1 [Amborella trichopoda]
MAGIALLLDLISKDHGLSDKSSVLSRGVVSASFAVSATLAASPFASRLLSGRSTAFCDAAAVLNGDYVSNSRRVSWKGYYSTDPYSYTTKEYPVELKPLFSAFHWKALALTSLRSFLMFYLPLLEPHPPPKDDDDDDDLLTDEPEEKQPVDLVVPLKNSVIQIFRETTVVTTRRVLERIAVHYVSRRMAWKLLKDMPKSATRKYQRGTPTVLLFYGVAKSTLRGHFLGVAASWLVQVGIEIYRCVHVFVESSDEDLRSEQIQLLWRNVWGATLRCGASLAFAPIGAGFGAAIIHPSLGQWVGILSLTGCALGDLAGPYMVAFCFDKLHHLDV